MGFDYGNARIAAMRGRLIDGRDVLQLAESADAFAFLSTLERFPDWGPLVRTVAPLGGDPAAAAEAAIERHRGERLGLLPRLYDGRSRQLVEALVMGLDTERVLAVLRLRRAGLAVESIGATIVRGALLDTGMLGQLARAAGPATVIAVIARAGLIEQADQAGLLPAAAADRARPEDFEAALVTACAGARNRRAAGRGRDAALVRWGLERERQDRTAVAQELRENGAVAASLVERTLALTRFDDFAIRGRRDPLGIGAVMGYVAAVEGQAIRLRAALARVGAGWSTERFGSFVGNLDGGSGGRPWAAWSS
jgi:vacuolar-type H+-ATPase subunit C/Vma6